MILLGASILRKIGLEKVFSIVITRKMLPNAGGKKSDRYEKLFSKLVQFPDQSSEVVVCVSEWIVKEPIRINILSILKLASAGNYYRRGGLRKVFTKLKSRFYEREQSQGCGTVFRLHSRRASEGA